MSGHETSAIDAYLLSIDGFPFGLSFVKVEGPKITFWSPPDNRNWDETDSDTGRALATEAIAALQSEHSDLVTHMIGRANAEMFARYGSNGVPHLEAQFGKELSRFIWANVFGGVGPHKENATKH